MADVVRQIYPCNVTSIVDISNDWHPFDELSVMTADVDINFKSFTSVCLLESEPEAPIKGVGIFIEYEKAETMLIKCTLSTPCTDGQTWCSTGKAPYTNKEEEFEYLFEKEELVGVQEFRTIVNVDGKRHVLNVKIYSKGTDVSGLIETTKLSEAFPDLA